MNAEEIREYCLAKMFALLDLSEKSRGICLKCDPELAIELGVQHPEVTPGWYFNKIIVTLFYTVKGNGGTGST